MSHSAAVAEQHRATLSLAVPFDQSDLKAAYHTLIMKWHPDRNNVSPQAYAKATEKAKIINLAYEYLSEYLENNGGIYRGPGMAKRTTSRSPGDFEPKREYKGKTYTVGFPDPTITEIFVKSSHIISTGYDQSAQTLYIKFSGNVVYRYFNVPRDVFEAFVAAPSHGKFGHRKIYSNYRQERC